MNADGGATFNIEVVDSVTRAPVMPIYQITIGNHAPLIMLPDSFPYMTYAGQPVAHAYIRIRVTTMNLPDSLIGMSGIYMHHFPDGEQTGFAKKTHSAGRLGNVPEEINPLHLTVYPNPFSKTASITYVLPFEDADEFVDAKVYDMMINDVSHLVQDIQQAGRHEISLDGTNLPAGKYFVAVHTKSHQQSKRLLLMK
jgi:hypothetical protein